MSEVAGAPDIAHAFQRKKWEQQMAFVMAWSFTMWERAESDDKKAPQALRDEGQAARAELQRLLGGSLDVLLRLACTTKDRAGKEWAQRILADFFVRIGKHVGKVKIGKPYRKLMESAAFRAEKEKIGKLRADVLFPKLIGRVVQRELKKTELYRERLILLSAIDNRKIPEADRQRFGLVEDWQEIMTEEKIPEPYWPTMELPEFSVESEPQWWKILWPIIKKNNPEILETLRSGAIPTRGIRYYSSWKTYRREFRKVLKTLARLRSGGAR